MVSLQIFIKLNTIKIFITLTIKMSQTFLMLNLYILLKLQLLTTKFSSLFAELFLVYWSVVCSKQMNVKYTNYLFNAKIVVWPCKNAPDFQHCNIQHTLVPSKRCWWGYGDGCSSISWPFMGDLIQDFLWTIYYIHGMNYFEVQRRGNRIKFRG